MTDQIAEALEGAPATPAGRQAAWYLLRLHHAGESGELDDFKHYSSALLPQSPLATNDEGVRDIWRANAARVGALQSLAFVVVSDLEVEATLVAKERRWKFTLAVDPAPPHQITRLSWERLHEFKLDVREATSADAAVLSDIERRCPIVLDDTKIWFERGNEYFAFSRLMEDCTVGLASVDDVPAAVTCGARHTVRIGGELKSIITVSHLRVLPEHQRKGLWGAANKVLEKYWSEVDGSNAYISVDNAGMQHGFRHTRDKWPNPFLWVRLPCSRLTGPNFGRPATPEDARSIIKLVNAFHDDEEMFVPYTEKRFIARVDRAPDLYGWNRIWLADGAVLGVWPAGPALRLVTERAGVQSISEPGVVLDYGFAPGADGAFESLLRAWCGALAARGMDRLSIFTSKASRGAALLTSLTDEVEAYNMWTPGIAVPARAQEKGLYVDPIYF